MLLFKQKCLNCCLKSKKEEEEEEEDGKTEKEKKGEGEKSEPFKLFLDSFEEPYFPI